MKEIYVVASHYYYDVNEVTNELTKVRGVFIDLDDAFDKMTSVMKEWDRKKKSVNYVNRVSGLTVDIHKLRCGVHYLHGLNGDSIIYSLGCFKEEE